MKISRSLSIAAGAALLATLSGCVVAPVGPRYHGPYGYAEPVYVAPPAVVVAPVPPPPPRYYGGPRYRYWR
jgi:hypothetical protein